MCTVFVTGSKFHGSRLPWRDLICILETIALDATHGVSTQRKRKARSGPGVQGSGFTVIRPNEMRFTVTGVNFIG